MLKEKAKLIPPSLFERLKEKGKQRSVLKFQRKTEVKAGKKKRSQKTLEAFMDSGASDSDVPMPKKVKKVISKPEPAGTPLLREAHFHLEPVNTISHKKFTILTTKSSQ